MEGTGFSYALQLCHTRYLPDIPGGHVIYAQINVQ